MKYTRTLILTIGLLMASTSNAMQAGSPAIYVAKLTQNGTAAPTVEVLENTLGDVVWTREQTGILRATLKGAFTSKTVILIGPESSMQFNGSQTAVCQAELGGDDNSIHLGTQIIDYSADEVRPIPNDYVLSKTTIEIRVY